MVRFLVRIGPWKGYFWKMKPTLILLASLGILSAQEVISIWPVLAPGETTKNRGETLPANLKDPSITRVQKVTQPTLTAFLPPKGSGNGTAVIVLPGGGFSYVVPDLEGSETAKFLNESGISVFVLKYRTTANGPKVADAWKRPLQDSQRAVRYVRAHGDKWGIDSLKIGIMAFSAGGQVGAIHLGDHPAAYVNVDGVDRQSSRPDFAMLIYPWRTYVPAIDGLKPEIQISKTAPPTFIVHTSDDASTSLGAVGIYAALKKAKVSAELHIYQNGGHGYGARDREGSAIGSWSDRAMEWLRIRGLAR